MIPVLGVGSYEETVSHYVEWLGFEVRLGISRRTTSFCYFNILVMAFHLLLDSTSEPETSTGSWTAIYVSDLEAMSEAIKLSKI